MPRLPRAFWRFLAAASLYELGAFVFVVIYNLHLVDLGFREDLIGLIAGAYTAGSIAGAIPAGWLVRRIGLRDALIAAFVANSALFAARSLVLSETPLIALAFVSGIAMALWAVSFTAAIADLAGDELRPFAYSLMFSSGIGIGVLGGMLGGRLPAWIPASPPKQGALFAGAAIILLAVVPAWKLRFSAAPATERKTYPRGPFVTRFFVALAAWSFAMGAFNPFFNTYFSKHLGTPVERVGVIFAAGQAAQVVAMLAAPMLFRRIGTLRGIVVTQVAASLALAALAGAPAGLWAASVYATFMAFQWMSEPGLYSMLMGRVASAERGGAAAINFLVMSAAQACVAPAAGKAYAAFGSGAVLPVAGVCALIAAALFGYLLSPNQRDGPPGEKGADLQLSD